MHWERGRERMREGKERKEKKKGRVVRQGERGGKGVRKEGKKKSTGLPTMANTRMYVVFLAKRQVILNILLYSWA